MNYGLPVWPIWGMDTGQGINQLCFGLRSLLFADSAAGHINEQRGSARTESNGEVFVMIILLQ